MNIYKIKYTLDDTFDFFDGEAIDIKSLLKEKVSKEEVKAMISKQTPAETSVMDIEDFKTQIKNFSIKTIK